MKSSDFNQIITKLKHKFSLVDKTGHHISYEVWFNGVLVTIVKNSHSSNDYIDTLIAKNLHISKTDLREYKSCTLSNENLIEKIKAKNRWPTTSASVNMAVAQR